MAQDYEKLRESSLFLNLLLDHVPSAVLVVDEDLKIHKFNNSFVDMFDRAADQLILEPFGQISGCVNAVTENQPCGSTSRCRFCVLRKSLIRSMAATAPVNRERLHRTFYIDGQPVEKLLEFSATPILFDGRRMILVILNDITETERQKRELEEKQAQIEKDLQAAREIQTSLLPQEHLKIPNVEIVWRCEPFGLVGGDIFQIHADTTDHISMYIIDVCGHGVSAAMVSVSVSQFLHSLQNRMRITGKSFSPAEVIERLDREFPLNRFDCFFTAVYATLDVRTGSFAYSNAGHVPPVILRADGRLEILDHHGPVVGAGIDTVFDQQQSTLLKGDKVFLYTDGLLDNFGPHGESRGKQLFYEHLQHSTDLYLGRIVTELFSTIRTLRGKLPPSDDMSVVAMEFKGIANR